MKSFFDLWLGAAISLHRAANRNDRRAQTLRKMRVYFRFEHRFVFSWQARRPLSLITVILLFLRFMSTFTYLGRAIKIFV